MPETGRLRAYRLNSTQLFHQKTCHCSAGTSVRLGFFSPRTFFLQCLGVGLLYWVVSTQRNCWYTGQSPGSKMGVFLVHIRAPRGRGSQIQAMLYKRGAGVRLGAAGSRGMWARNSLRGARKPSTLLWEDVSPHNKLAARAVKVA